jgi:tripartite-type tricarboxylate transporter receptor subunit TctC
MRKLLEDRFATLRRLALPILLFIATAQPAAAADASKAQYEGRQFRVIAGFPPAGGYDLYARAVARHLPKYLPRNPSVIVQNMPGAGSMVTANYLYNVAKPDGLTIGTFSRALPFSQLVGSKGVEFDARKFNWIGSPNQEVSFCAIRADSGVTSLEQAVKKPAAVIFGGSGPGADTAQFPQALSETFKVDFKLILGYGGMAPILGAVERNEVNAFCGSWGSVKLLKPDWFKDKYVHVIVQMGMEAHPELKGVPLLIQSVKSEEDRRFLEVLLSRQVTAYPFAAPPGVLPERVAMLRQAFNQTMRDAEFLRESEKMGLDVNPVSGERIQKLINEIFEVSPKVRKRLEIFR